MVANLDALQIRPTENPLLETFRNSDLSGHTEELARSIKAVVMAASSVGRLESSKWAGSESNFLYSSEYAGPLDDTWRTRMEQWIPPPTVENRPDISTGFSASTEMTDKASPAEDEIFQDYESDDEIDLEIVQTLIESGERNYDQQRYAEAAKFYRAGIDRAKHLSQAKVSSLELEEVNSRMKAAEAKIESDPVQRIFKEAQQAFAKGDYCEAADIFRNGISLTRELTLDARNRLDLRVIQQKSAISFLHQGDIDGAERAFKDMVRQQIIDDESRTYTLHASSGLALVHLCRRDFVASERWCRQSLVGWKRLLGREHSLYNKSLQLLAFIYEVKGDFATASALDILSRDLKTDIDKDNDARIGNLVTTGFDTTSSRAIVNNYYMGCANRLLHDLCIDLQADDFEKEEALLKLIALPSVPGSGIRSISNITFAVRSLLDQGANPNARNGRDDTTALMEASTANLRDVVQLLCEQGADVNAKAKDGSTALHYAVWAGNSAVVKLLLKEGANTEATDGIGDTALIGAVDDGRDSIAVILLQAGASASAINPRGQTALASAARRGNADMAKILLDGGADIESTDDDGSTPLFVASSWDKVEMVGILVAAGAKVDARNLSGATPLMSAAEMGNIASMGVLLDAGANIDTQDDRGWTAATALFRKCEREECQCNFCSELAVRSDLLRVLVLRGANLSLKIAGGHTTIDLAKRYDGKDRADIIAILKEALAIEGRSISRNVQ